MTMRDVPAESVITRATKRAANQQLAELELLAENRNGQPVAANKPKVATKRPSTFTAGGPQNSGPSARNRLGDSQADAPLNPCKTGENRESNFHAPPMPTDQLLQID